MVESNFYHFRASLERGNYYTFLLNMVLQAFLANEAIHETLEANTKQRSAEEDYFMPTHSPKNTTLLLILMAKISHHSKTGNNLGLQYIKAPNM